nr:uncharacterized protein LOC126517397 [Dermacentor andersoni]
MVAWPPPSLVCTVAVLLRVGIAAAGVMSRRRVHQQQSGSSPSGAARHHDDVVEDGAAAADPVMLLPELVGRLLNEAAARVDDEAVRLDDGVVWKPLREPDQVKAAGEHVSGLPEVKNELRSIDEAAAVVESDVFPSRFQSSAVASRLRQQAAEKAAPIKTAILEDRDPGTDADMAQNHPSGSNNSGKDAANRSGTPTNQRIPQEPNHDDKADACDDASATTNRAREEQRDVVAVDDNLKGDDSLPGGPEVGSKATLTETLDVADASVQVDAAPAEEARLPPDAQPVTTTAEPRKRVATVDREMQTATPSKKSSTKDRQSQTLPTTPTLYSMATQTEFQDAPWYAFRTSVQKKKLAAIISAVFVLVYFILCYGLVNAAREMYAEHVFEELDFL